jgi:splicing factor 3A subunit 3
MRALGIPNTKDFYEVTKIEDAMALWKTLKSRQASGPRPGRRGVCSRICRVCAGAPRPARMPAPARPRRAESAAPARKRLQGGGFNPETDEELEDAEGNVFNKKTYEDLRRQGLI